MPAARSRVARSSVSAEAFGGWNLRKSFEAKVIKKKLRQKTKISEKLDKSFMFANLDDKEKEIVVNAIDKRKVKKGEVVI